MTNSTSPLPFQNPRLFGDSPWTAEQILREATTGTSLERIPGDFVVTASAERDGSTHHIILSSVTSVRPYHYLNRPGAPFLHGTDVFDIVHRAGVPWRWNERALRSLLWLGHTVGHDTLHTDVLRIPSAAILIHDGTSLRIEHQPFWETIFDGPRASLDEAVETFRLLTDEVMGERPLIPLTAGFDSRALLARALSRGRRPSVITMGYPESTDRVVASAIARAYSLEHHLVELDARDYLTHASTIVRLTGGTKTVSNWHTFLYAKIVGELGVGPVLVGSNGEFARTYYLDMGLPAQVFGLAPAQALFAYFGARLERRRRRCAVDLPFLGPEGPRTAMTLAWELARLTTAAPSTLDGLDLFYATQRLRHFIGNGHALYAAHAQISSPFLDARFLRIAARLPRSAKLGSQLHRRVIERDEPALLGYPVGSGPTMAPRAPTLYWTRRAKAIGYSAFAQLLEMPEVKALLIDSSPLDGLCNRRQREQIVADKRVDLMDLLLTLHFAAEAAHAAST